MGFQYGCSILQGCHISVLLPSQTGMQRFIEPSLFRSYTKCYLFKIFDLIQKSHTCFLQFKDLLTLFIFPVQEKVNLKLLFQLSEEFIKMTDNQRIDQNYITPVCTLAIGKLVPVVTLQYAQIHSKWTTSDDKCCLNQVSWQSHFSISFWDDYCQSYNSCYVTSSGFFAMFIQMLIMYPEWLILKKTHLNLNISERSKG